MSALERHGDQVAMHLTAERVRAAGRSRRADDGSLTEMARSLLREAGESDAARAAERAGPAGARPRDGRRTGPPMRFTRRSFATGRA
jgi:hypothetical protein